jgi:hypothetical protein
MDQPLQIRNFCRLDDTSVYDAQQIKGPTQITHVTALSGHVDVWSQKSRGISLNKGRMMVSKT